MLAIIVKYQGPSDQRGARMRATAGPAIKGTNRAYDHEHSVTENAMLCAADFIRDKRWYPNSEPGAKYGAFWTMGEMPNGDCVFVNHSAQPWHDSRSIDTREWVTT